MGLAEIDSGIAERLVEELDYLVETEPELQAQEHSLESEIPFLQATLGENLKIVPIMFGSLSPQEAIDVGQVLGELVQEGEIFLVASSDMSHFHPYNTACNMDSLTLSVLEALDMEALISGIRNREMELCGFHPVLALMKAARDNGVRRGINLKYANSGDVPQGEKGRVVGYCSVLYLTPEERGEKIEEEEEAAEVLTTQQKAYLLTLARRTIKSYIDSGKMPEVSPPDDEVLRRKRAVFVTLHDSAGRLRGCIGQMVAQQPVWEAVMNMAISAATKDYRFRPVTKEEVDDLGIEISILTPLKRITDWRKIQLGKHGVYIRKGMRSGVFLPQVGRDHDFTLESFLAELCTQKAGLPPDAYKDPSVEIYTFTVEEFSEQELGVK